MFQVGGTTYAKALRQEGAWGPWKSSKVMCLRVQTLWNRGQWRWRRSVGHVPYAGLYPRSSAEPLKDLKQRGMLKFVL